MSRNDGRAEYMNNQEILNNAPEGQNMIEINEEGDFNYRKSHDCLIRSLADIERIVELESLLKETMRIWGDKRLLSINVKADKILKGGDLC